MGHLCVRDVGYNGFQKKPRLEDEIKISRGPINVQKGVIPNGTDKTALDATLTQKAPKSLFIGRVQIKEMADDNDDFCKRDVFREKLEKGRRIAAPRHIVLDADNVVRETMKTHHDNVENESKVIKNYLDMR